MNLLFCSNGRRIVPRGLQANICNPDADYNLEQPEINYAERLDRLAEFLCQTGISANQFQNEAEKIKADVLANEQISNLFKGIHLPIIIPQNIAGIKDVGTLLDSWLPAVGNSYKSEFPEGKLNVVDSFSFANFDRRDSFKHLVKVVKESRQEQLIEKTGKQPVIGWYFPSPLQGYSVEAQREQMATLPDNLILSGIDGVIAQIMFPEILTKSWRTPGYDLSAFSCYSVGYSLAFKKAWLDISFFQTGYLGFNEGGYLACANSRYSGGLFAW